MYFDSFPVIVYDSVGNGTYKDVTNILRRVAMRSKIKQNTLIYDTYDVKEGETPEMIADRLYNDPELHWVILIVNDITDRYHQWPLSTSQFLAFINDKYVNADGTSNVDGVHHYEIPQSSGDTKTKIEVYQNSALYTGDSDFYASASIVTNFEYEENEQDEKRKIRLLDPSYIDQFVTEFKALMKESII
jgi:hypothetical protein